MSKSFDRRHFVGGVLGAGALTAFGVMEAAAASAAPVRSAAVATPKPVAAAVSSPVLKLGSKGAAVTELQNRLAGAGFWLGTPDGSFGAVTQQAVYAVQKANGLSRDGVVGPATWATVRTGARARARSYADGIEIDKTRQLLMVVRGGAVQLALNTSTGSGQKFLYNGRWITAVTPSGNYKFWYRYPGTGWQYGALGGMWRPVYFNGDIAVHGSLEIPPYPASHGCCRLSCTAQDYLLARNYLALGTQVRVY